MRFLILGRLVGLKKKKKPKKNHKKSRNSRSWYPRMTLKVNIHIFGLPKCTIFCEKCSCFCSCFLYAVTMLIFQIKRIISSEKWCNYFVTFFFFLKMSKIWVGWTMVNGEKKDDGLSLIEQRESTLLTLWPVEDLQYTVETW